MMKFCAQLTSATSLSPVDMQAVVTPLYIERHADLVAASAHPPPARAVWADILREYRIITGE